MENATNKNKKKQASSSLLKDERFKALFNNPDFQVDKNSEEFALLNPVIAQLDKSKAKKLKQKLAQEEEEEEIPKENEPQGKNKNIKCCFYGKKKMLLCIRKLNQLFMLIIDIEFSLR